MASNKKGQRPEDAEDETDAELKEIRVNIRNFEEKYRLLIEKRNEMNGIFSFKRKVFVDQGFCIEIH